ncbi:hypothetical protein [Marinobacter sp.]|uniref:hypothetical protein n=1 Tax=Marinobacter sp. TaxID=50741 RepID=UPI0019C19B3A|nr:hypothetical protein [Marinobacter sp.]MBC7193028.1 hypothetical protein [Marinobacter sp.]
MAGRNVNNGYVELDLAPVSDAFDPNAQNLIILADVGVGTVDCAMFKVRPDKFSKNFNGVSVKSSPEGPLGLHNPDAEFDQRLRAQIQEGTLKKGKESGG